MKRAEEIVMDHLEKTTGMRPKMFRISRIYPQTCSEQELADNVITAMQRFPKTEEDKMLYIIEHTYEYIKRGMDFCQHNVSDIYGVENRSEQEMIEYIQSLECRLSKTFGLLDMAALNLSGYISNEMRQEIRENINNGYYEKREAESSKIMSDSHKELWKDFKFVES